MGRGDLKKGPWSSEEDEVLLKHVEKYGPLDWNSIRSNGLLQRTAKSCRFSWSNNLRPNLKRGCKFSAEEEKLVIELQEQFGNKWAKIATYLEGRTDNDVKNFWSIRRKRMERSFPRTPSPPSKQQESKGKVFLLNEVKVDKVPECGSSQLEEDKEVFKRVDLPDLTKPDLESELSAVQVEAIPLHTIPSFESSSGYNFPLLPESQMDFPLFPECRDLIQEPFDPNFMDIFEHKKCSECVWSQKLETRLQTLGLEGNEFSEYKFKLLL